MNPTNNPLKNETPVPQPITTQPADNVTINTTSVVSKIGLYARITFFDLWILVLATTGAIVNLINATSSDSRKSTLVFLISVLVITVPIFEIANSKRIKELKKNPKLVDDVFLKKYIRKNLFASVILTGISAFYTVWILLSSLLLSKSYGTSKVKAVVDSLVSVIGFGAILVFAWGQHAKTTK